MKIQEVSVPATRGLELLCQFVCGKSAASRAFFRVGLPSIKSRSIFFNEHCSGGSQFNPTRGKADTYTSSKYWGACKQMTYSKYSTDLSDCTGSNLRGRVPSRNRWNITFHVLLNAQAILEEKQQWIYLTHCWEDKRVHAFRKDFNAKVNVMAWLEFELGNFKAVVQYVSHYLWKTPLSLALVRVIALILRKLWIQIPLLT